MTKPITQNFYISQISLFSSIISYCHSMMLICEIFLCHDLTKLVTVISLTCLYLITHTYLQMSKSYESAYWNYFLLMSAHISNNDSTNWNFLVRFAYLLLGFAFFFVYAVYVQCRRWRGSSRRQEEEEQRPEEQRLPLIVDIGFGFVGNGIALMGRWFIPSENMAWIFSGAAIFFLVSAMFFYCYYKYSSVSETQVHPHTE